MGAQTAIGPSQSPSRSLETAHPVGRVLRPGLLPWGQGWRFQDRISNRSPDPLVRRVGRDHPFL